MLCCWTLYQVSSTVQENRAALHAVSVGAQKAFDPNGAGVPTVFNEARDITIAILKPCIKDKPETCGLIPSIRSVAVSAGGAVDAMKNQVNQTQPLIQNAALAISDTSNHVNKAIDAATNTTLQARTDLQTLNMSIAASKPLLEAYTQSGVDLNKILEQKAITQILDQTAGITTHGNSIAGNLDKVSTKLTNDFVTTKPWYRRIAPSADDLWYLAAHAIP